MKATLLVGNGTRTMVLGEPDQIDCRGYIPIGTVTCGQLERMENDTAATAIYLDLRVPGETPYGMNAKQRRFLRRVERKLCK